MNHTPRARNSREPARKKQGRGRVRVYKYIIARTHGTIFKYDVILARTCARDDDVVPTYIATRGESELFRSKASPHGV